MVGILRKNGYEKDPKPNPSESPYSTFAGNPIWHSDPYGDTIKTVDWFTLWTNYLKDGTPKDIYNKAGGNVAKLFNDAEAAQKKDPTKPNGYTNTCALRMSMDLNSSGEEITNEDAKGKYAVKDGEKKNDLLRVGDMTKLLNKKYGKPDIVLNSNDKDIDKKLKNVHGIIVFEVQGWGDASGHVTLLNNNLQCGHNCYFQADIDRAHPNNSDKPVIKKVSVWIVQ